MEFALEDFLNRALVAPSPSRDEEPTIGVALLFERANLNMTIAGCASPDEFYGLWMTPEVMACSMDLDTQGQIVARLAAHLDVFPNDGIFARALRYAPGHLAAGPLIAYLRKHGENVDDMTRRQALEALEDMIAITPDDAPDPSVRAALKGWDVERFAALLRASPDEMTRGWAEPLLVWTALQLR
jgi:hypothetical protein